MSKITRSKMSEAKLGRPKSETHRKNMSIAQHKVDRSGQIVSQEQKIKISNTLKGRKLTIEHKAALSAGQQNRKPWTPEMKLAQSTKLKERNALKRKSLK